MRCSQCKVAGDPREVLCRSCGHIRVVARISLQPLVVLCCVFLVLGSLGFIGFIECEEDETYVSSLGPDRMKGTTDDITIPERGGR